MAYDALGQNHSPSKASKEYLLILSLAAKENETAVDEVLRFLFSRNHPISVASVETLLFSSQKLRPITDVTIRGVFLRAYDCLFGRSEAWA